MKRILVTGASGFLGWNLFQQRPKESEWIGTYHRHPVQWPDARLVRVDLTKPSEVARLLESVRPDLVIHTAAISDAHWCEEYPEASHQINVIASEQLAKQCKTWGCRIVYVSTDLVFDGTAAPYAASNQPNPQSVYGKQKAEAEQLVWNAYLEATIARVPLMYGTNGPVSTNHLSNLLEQWKAGREIPLFTDEFRTPADGASVARGLYLAAQHSGTTLHLGGPERLSRYDFGLRVAKAFGLPTEQIKPTRQADLNLPAPRPKDVSLDSSEAYALGYAPTATDEALKSLAANCR